MTVFFRWILIRHLKKKFAFREQGRALYNKMIIIMNDNRKKIVKVF